MKSSETTVPSQGYSETLEFDPQFRGPVKQRSCTDIICLFLFVAFIAGWIVVSIFAFKAGDPRILIYPTDTYGNICGYGKLEKKQYVFFFDLLTCARPSVIVTGCPTHQICVESCPNETFIVRPGVNKNKLYCKYDVDVSKKTEMELVNSGDCAKYYLKSKPLLGRCIPEDFLKTPDNIYVVDSENKPIVADGEKLTVEKIKKATAVLAKFLSLKETGEKVFSDFKTSWHFILIGLVLSMVISFLWIILMRWVAGVMIWLSIVFVLVFTAFACYHSTTKYIQLKDSPGADAEFTFTTNLSSYLALKKTWLALAIITGVIFAILFLVVIFLRKRIIIAVALIKEASKAVACMMSSLFFPIIPYVLQLIIFAVWAVIALYIASSGKASFVVSDVPAGSNVKNGSTCDPKNFTASVDGAKCLFQAYGLQNNLFSAHIYNVFGLFWGIFFVVGLCEVSLAGAFASYYWTLKKETDLPRWAVSLSLYRCMRYHLGSVAFGSVLIAIVRFIRVMLEYVDRKCKEYDNQFTKAILCCMKCCFWCLENVLKFITKNAYIMIAVYGQNFCNSARRAFKLLWRNIVRVVVLDKVTDFLLFMGKLVIVAVSACVSFYFFASEDKRLAKYAPNLNYHLIPPIFITLGSYVIASCFFSVYGMAVDTLFLCFLEDCERNDGSPEKPYHMSKELMLILDKQNKLKQPATQ